MDTASLVDQFLERSVDAGRHASTAAGGPSSFAGVARLIDQQGGSLQRPAPQRQQRTTFVDIATASALDADGPAAPSDDTGLPFVPPLLGCGGGGGGASVGQTGGGAAASLKRRHASDGGQPPASKRAHVGGSNAGAGVNHGSSLAAAQRDFVLRGMPPLDWSLKTGARFMSPARLEGLEQAAGAAPGRVACAALRGFANGCDWLSEREALHQALCTWQCPGAPLPAAAAAALSASGPTAGGAVLAARRALFREGLRGLHLALRHGCCDAFYVVPPDGARRRVVALFRGAGVAGHRCVHALLSRSTAGLRARLRAGDYALRYSLPLAPDIDASEKRAAAASAGGAAAGRGGGGSGELDEDGDGRVGGADGGRERDGPSSKELAAVDDGPRSLLLVEGGPGVAALYDLLYNEGAGALLGGGDGTDAPLLLAPAPFPGATLVRLRPKLLTPSTTAGDGQTLFRAELGSGCGGGSAAGAVDAASQQPHALLPPWVVQRLQACLVQGQAGDLRASYETHRLTTTLNLRLAQLQLSAAGRAGCDGDGGSDDAPAAAPAAAADGSAPPTSSGGGAVDYFRSGCFSEQEHHARRQLGCALQGGYVRQLDVRGGEADAAVSYRLPAL